jgi:hypothetical protein
MILPPIESDPVGEVKQPDQQFPESDKDDPDDAGGGEHLADHQRPRCAVDSASDFQEGHQGDLRSNPDQQQQERVDHQIDVN